ncbi:collagen-binding protein [Rufibacter glacialis]|nr:collagen-binding protein [Rufibacter glacialis]
MKIYFAGVKPLILLLLFFLNALLVLAQKGPLEGRVVEAESGKPLEYVTVHVASAKVPVFTDANGKFILLRYQPTDTVTFTLLGFAPLALPVKVLAETPVIRLVRQSYSLQEVVVRPKENPAYRIVRSAARNKHLYLPENQEAIQFGTYTLLKGSILEGEAHDKRKSFSKRYAPYLDSLSLKKAGTKTASLPIFQAETVKETYFSRFPRKSKEILKASKTVGVGIERESQVAQLLNAQAEHFSLYQNWVRMFDKDFVSPVANQWSSYYDYTLEDSLETPQGKVYRLKVHPKRAQDLAFEGTIWISDGSFALRRAELKVNPAVALNFVAGLQITQAWDDQQPSLLPIFSERKFQLTGLPGTEVRLFIESRTTYTGLALDQPKPAAFFDMTHQIHDSALTHQEQYWQRVRPQELSLEDQKRVQSIAQINKLPEIRGTVKLVRVMMEGHLPLNEKVEWGPVLGTYVYNEVEGHRLQVGGRTTAQFHPNWIVNGYLAYGTKDASFKSLLNLRYVIDRHRWTEWGGSYLQDVGPATLDLDNSQVSSLFFSAFRWGNMSYPYQQERLQLWAEREWIPGLRQRVTVRRANYVPSFAPGAWSSARDQKTFGRFQTTDITLAFRYTADQKMLIRHHEKIPISTSTAPLFGLHLTAGIKGVMDSDFSYQQVGVSLEQRVRAGIFGYARYYLKAGKTFTRVPLPLLQVPLGNQTPFFVMEGFNLMPFFSFATDEFASLRYDHHFEGAFSLTNRLPLLKKTKLILVAGGAVLYGHLSEKNWIASTGLAGETPRFQGLGKNPYAEVNVGFKNIYQLLRVDLVHRLTYQDLEAPRWGVCVSVAVNP